jgi:hypothetical protein
MKTLRLCLVVLIALGIVLPRGSAVLAGAVGLGPGLLVVCTPAGLVTIRLGADGTPVETKGDPQHCALVHAAGTAMASVEVRPGTDGYAPVALWSSLPAPHSATRHAPNTPRAPPGSSA